MTLSMLVSLRRSSRSFADRWGRYLTVLPNGLVNDGQRSRPPYLALEPEGTIFAVVRKAKLFDPAFEDALSILDLEIAQDSEFNLIKLRVLALPTIVEGDRCFLLGTRARIPLRG